MRPQLPQTILITGASTGIGLALVRLLLPTQHRLIITSRLSSLDRFEEEGFKENDRLMIRPLDVCDFDQGTRLIQEINQRWGGVDVLVNNAGISYRSVVEQMRDVDEEEQMKTNYLGPMHLTREVLPYMRDKKRGHIINVSSVGGMMAMPTMSSYSASKFALEGASESLWYELRPWGITVTLIQPGFVHSNAFQKVRLSPEGKKSLEDENDPYHYDYVSMGRFVEKLMLRSWSTSESIAKIIFKVIHKKKPPLRIQATLDARFFSLLRRLLPRKFYHWFLYRSLPEIKKWGPHD